MKYLCYFVFIVVFSGCSYAQRVKSFDDVALCKNLGRYTLHEHNEGVSLTKNEIFSRDIDKDYCSNIANQTIDELKPGLKLRLCQSLAASHYRGDYPNFKRTLEKVQRLGLADEECSTMAEFYMNRIARKKEKDRALSNAINQAFGRGSYYNPVYIKLQ